MSLAEIFKDTSISDKLDGAVASPIRNLARDDLYKAITESNRELVRTYKLDPKSLKSDREIEELVSNTEKSIFKYNGNNTKDYLETVLTFLVFLTDKYLMKDAVLFRFLLNVELKDLFIDHDSAEPLFGDLIYCKGDISSKHRCRVDIVNQIEEKLMDILYDYLNGQHYTAKEPLRYNIPTSLAKQMTRYRNIQLDKILRDMIFDDDAGSSSGDENSYDSDGSSVPSIAQLFSDDESIAMESDGSHMSSNSKSSKSAHNSNVPSSSESDMDSDLLSESSELSDESDDSDIDEPTRGESESGSESDNIPQSIESGSIPASIETIDSIESAKKIASIISVPQSSTSSTSSNASNSSSTSKSSAGNREKTGDKILCDYCKTKYFTHSYRTPVIEKKEVHFKYFCSMKCMETWVPK